MKSVSGSILFPSYECPAGTLITARSHLVDRFHADCEVVQLPPREVAGNTLNYETKQTVTRTKMMNEKRFMGPWKPKKRDIKGRYIVEFRRQSPANWAHLLNDHMPNYFAACDDAGVSPDDCTILLPKLTPKHVLAAMDFFGLTYECTNDDIQGDVFHIDKLGGNRAIRHKWVNLPLLRDRLQESRRLETAPEDLPSKIYLSRRGNRVVENEPEILRVLEGQGFVRIYPEDHSVSDQFHLFQEAEAIVGIHGAGWAPLLYRKPDTKPARIVELLPCGLMSNNFRTVSHQVGSAWIGVRGQIKPEHIKPAYNLEEPMTKFSWENFVVDPYSLELALSMFDAS